MWLDIFINFFFTVFDCVVSLFVATTAGNSTDSTAIFDAKARINQKYFRTLLLECRRAWTQIEISELRIQKADLRWTWRCQNQQNSGWWPWNDESKANRESAPRIAKDERWLRKVWRKMDTRVFLEISKLSSTISSSHGDGFSPGKDRNLKLWGKFIYITMPVQFLGIYIKNLSTTATNKEKGPVGSLKIPNLELLFDGCVVKNSRMLFIALALNHINVSPFQIVNDGQQHNLNSELSSRSFTRIINKILRENRIKHVWQK